jgi:hypothetical protein
MDRGVTLETIKYKYMFINDFNIGIIFILKDIFLIYLSQII